MPSFSTLFIAATVAFATFTSATPITPSSINIVRKGVYSSLPSIPVNPPYPHDPPASPPSHPSHPPSNPSYPPSHPNNKRCASDCATIPVILDGVNTKISAISARLNVIVAANVGVKVGVDVLTPCLGDMKSVLVQAVIDVKALVSLSPDVVLVSGGKVLGLLDICHLLVTFLSLVCAILSLCVRIVVSVDAKVVLGLAVDIGSIVAELLVVIFGIVNGLQAVLCPLLVSLHPVVYGLGLDALIKVIVIA